MVLNSSYEPIKVVGWQKAILLWFQGKVEILEHHDLYVRSVKLSFQLPSVIRLKTYVRIRHRTHIRFSRENVYIRDNYCCQYCEKPFPARELTLDHVLPVSRGGRKSWTNVVTACKHCNQKKGSKTPEQARMPLKNKPVMPEWLPENDFEFKLDSMPNSWRVYLFLSEDPLRLGAG